MIVIIRYVQQSQQSYNNHSKTDPQHYAHPSPNLPKPFAAKVAPKIIDTYMVVIPVFYTLDDLIPIAGMSELLLHFVLRQNNLQFCIYNSKSQAEWPNFSHYAGNFASDQSIKIFF